MPAVEAIPMNDNLNINTGGGDYASGNIDKRTGTFITGDVTIVPPRPPIDLAQAQQQLERLPFDRVPEPAPVPPPLAHPTVA